MVDLHVHLRDWAQSSKETVEHGLHVASMCGIRMVADMPNTSPALTSRDVVLMRLALASGPSRKYGVRYCIHMGLTADEAQIAHAVETYRELFPLVIGLKMFAGHSTGDMGIVTLEDQSRVFRTLSRLSYDGVLSIHCEKESLMHPELLVPGRFETQSVARPAQAEIESIRDMISLARDSGFPGHIHICHISTAQGIALVKKARGEGMSISCAATAHHALLTCDDARDGSRCLRMNPPLRSPADRDAVFAALASGDIDYVESDHAPHTLEDKIAGAGGIPGFDGTLHLLAALRNAGVGQDRLMELFCTRACEIFHVAADDFLPDDLEQRIRMVKGQYQFDPFR